MGKMILDRAQGLGLLLAAFGLISSVITFFDYELRILLWIEMWGSLIAWLIRGTLIVGGLGLFFGAAVLEGGRTTQG